MSVTTVSPDVPAEPAEPAGPPSACCAWRPRSTPPTPAQTRRPRSTPPTPAQTWPRANRLAVLAWEIFGELATAAGDRVTISAHLGELVMAARASVAAERGGEADPMIHLRHALSRHGWLPGPGASPAALLATVPALPGSMT